MSKNLIVKSYQVVEAGYKLTPSEIKLISILTSRIEKEDKDFKPHKFSIHYLLEVIGIGSRNHDDLKKMTKNLMRKILEIKEENRFIQAAFLSSAVYYDKLGVIELKFDPVLKPYLLDLKEHFIKYKLEQILNLHSFYSIRFYEMLIKWESIGFFKISLNEIRRYFQISEKEYPKYSNIKQKVILVAQKELKEKGDLYFEFREIKDSRKVIAIEFNIKRKRNLENKKNNSLDTKISRNNTNFYKSFEKQNTNEEIIQQIEKEIIELHDKEADRLIKKNYSVELIQEFLDYLNKEDKGLIVELHKKSGINNIFVNIELKKFVIKKYSEPDKFDFIKYSKSKGYDVKQDKNGKFSIS